MALNWQTLQIPLAAGLETGTDPRAQNPPSLAVCRDAQFDEQGGLQTRKPFATIGANVINTNGDAVTDCRRVVTYGDELLMFTKTQLYTWSASSSAWVYKARHMAVKVEESAVFARTSDQVCCDRAEMGNVVFYAWVDIGTTTSAYLAAADKTTGAVLLAPYSLGVNYTRPRLVAINSVVHLYVHQSATNQIAALILDPNGDASDWQTAASAPTALFSAYPYYDVALSPDGLNTYLATQRNGYAAYAVRKLDEDLTNVVSVVPGRTCDGPVAVAVSPDGLNVQIVRANGTNIQGDLLLASDLSDVYTAQALGTAAGTPVSQVTACYSTTAAAGVYTCTTFWSYQEDAAVDSWACKTGAVATDNTITAQSFLRYHTGLASRAQPRTQAVVRNCRTHTSCTPAQLLTLRRVCSARVASQR